MNTLMFFLVADNRRPAGPHISASWLTIVDHLADGYRPPDLPGRKTENLSYMLPFSAYIFSKQEYRSHKGGGTK